jgi:PKD domain-containing protein
MRLRSSLSRRAALLITIVSPALLGFVKCVFVSNPTVATARIERIEPLNPIVGDIVRVTGTGTGMQPLLFTWDFGDGTVVAEGMQAVHTYLRPGSFQIAFTVRDSSGNAARDTAQLTISPGIPTPKIPGMGLVLISAAVAGQPVVFKALPLDAKTNPVSYLWTFSDGQSVSGPEVTATFPVAGMYSASIATTNDLGETAVAHVAFQVNQR